MQYKPFIAFDFGKYNVEPDVMQGYQSVSDLDKEKPFAYAPFGFLASEKYLYSIVTFRSKIIQLFYSFSTKKLIYSNQLNNNIDAGFFSGPKEIDNDELICLVEPHSFIKRYNQIQKKYTKHAWDQFLKEHWKISDLLNQIELQDNPIIMRLKMNF